MFLQALSGGALGVLLGLLVGLSSSPIVTIVVSALTSALVAFLGISSSGSPATAPATNAFSIRAARLAGFGFAAALTIPGGIWMRTHEALSPSLHAQIAQLTDAGFTPDEAHTWVAYKNSGLLFRSTIPSTVDHGVASGSLLLPSAETAIASISKPALGAAPAVIADKNAPGVLSSGTGLMAGSGSDICLLLQSGRYASMSDQLQAMDAAGGYAGALAKSIVTKPPADQQAALATARKRTHCDF